MPRKRREPVHARGGQPRPPGPRRNPLTPDWLLFGLAMAGALLTGYLTIVALNQDMPAFCSTGSGCEVVQQSRWSKLLGLPIAFWGFGLYLLIALSALFVSPRTPSPWRRIWSLALLGVAISLYLTLAGAIALGAFCTWCLVSFTLLIAILVIATLRRPPNPGLPWRRWLVNQAIILAVVLGVMHIAQAGLLQRPEDPRLKALAEHLDARGAKFYGASWCPTCQAQKEIFGRSAERLPYVECSPNGRNGPVAFTCVSANVIGYPTWIIRGRPYQEVMQPEELARRSGFAWKDFVPPAED